MDRTPVFRWLSAGALPARWDLRLCGWRCARDAGAIVLVQQRRTIGPAQVLALSQRLGRVPADLRQRIVAVDVSSSTVRGRLLQVGIGDALPPGTNLIELAARAWRVAAAAEAQPRRRRAGPADLDLVRRDAVAGGRAAGLHPREFALLWQLAEAPGAVVGTAALLHALWHPNGAAETNSLQVHICRLRAKLRRIGLGDLIETVPGAGYRLAHDRPLLFEASGSIPMDQHLRTSG